MQAVDVAIAGGKGGVDTTRMAVLGGSYGGFMTNWIVGHTQRFRVAQTDRSIFNWYSWYGSSDAQGLTDYEFSGRPWESDSLYRALSPMQFARNIRTPLLIVHSEDDRRTPIANAEQLFVTLRERGVPAEFVRYPRAFPRPARSSASSPVTTASWSSGPSWCATTRPWPRRVTACAIASSGRRPWERRSQRSSSRARRICAGWTTTAGSTPSSPTREPWPPAERRGRLCATARPSSSLRPACTPQRWAGT